MSKGYNLGRAFEYACLKAIEEFVRSNFDNCNVQVSGNAYYLTVQSSYEKLSESEKIKLRKGAEAYLPTLEDLEPMLVYEKGVLLLSLQTDNQGKKGDVRDLIISRDENKWAIGLSLKHNHTAVKHSRLAQNLDFSESWFGYPCTDQYWEDIEPIFSYLQTLKGTKWSDLTDKVDSVYVPLMDAFTREFLRQYEVHNELPKLIVDYLVGKYDFYKVISSDNARVTYVEPFNVNGTLNKRSPVKSPTFPVDKISLPTRIVALIPKANSKTTVELYMDNGWQFSFRIHSASTLVEPSLKLDIQLVGRPARLVILECPWR